MPAGRPTTYRAEIHATETTTHLCLLGLTDDDLAFHFKASRDSINRWKNQHPEFRDAIARGRREANGRMAAALFKRGLGYDVDGKHIPGDFNAMSLFLRNREPELWRDRTEVVHDISDRVADRLEAARQRMLGQLEARVIEGEAAEIAAPQNTTSCVAAGATGIVRRTKPASD